MNKIAEQQLLDALGPLPVKGRSWPRAVALLAWALVLMLTWWLGLRASELHAEVEAQLRTPLTISVIACLLGLCVIAYYMWIGHTTISEHGIEQDWIFKRHMHWAEIRTVKFVPLLFSKRLICFPHRGRPIIFHGGERALEIAFAHISLAYSQPD